MAQMVVSSPSPGLELRLSPTAAPVKAMVPAKMMIEPLSSRISTSPFVCRRVTGMIGQESAKENQTFSEKLWVSHKTSARESANETPRRSEMGRF
jgi:hypothetical protein